MTAEIRETTQLNGYCRHCGLLIFKRDWGTGPWDLWEIDAIEAGHQLGIDSEVCLANSVTAEHEISAAGWHTGQLQGAKAFTEVTWDGKNLAAVQAATSHIQRTHGRPCAEVDVHWNLTLSGIHVPPGSVIRVTENRWWVN